MLSSTPKITDEFSKFAKLSHTVDIPPEKGWAEFAKSIGYTDQTLLDFLGNVDSGKQKIKDIDSYMQNSTKSTAAFGAALKNIAANIGIMLAISLVIKGISEAWDAANVTVSEVQNSIDETTAAYQELQQEYDSLSQKQHLTDAEQERLNYLKERLALDQQIIDAEKRQLNDEKYGTKFTDWFDPDNINTMYSQEMSRTNEEGFFNLQRKTNYGLQQLQETRDLIDQYQSAGKDVSRILNQEQNNIDQLSSYQDQLTVNLGTYFDMIESIQSDIDSGDLTESQLKKARASLSEWQDLYQKTKDTIDSINVAIGGFDTSSGDVEGTGTTDVQFTTDELNAYNATIASNADELNTLNDYTKEFDESQKEAWESATEGAKSAEDAIEKYEKRLSQTDFVNTEAAVQNLEKGFDQIASIYNDVKDGEEFDFSSILNNEEFSEVFSQYTDEYNNFIETISNSPNDIAACQDAFNQLATAYVYGSGCLDNLTETTRDATITQLEQMGVTNAQEVVESALAAQVEARRIGIENLNAATAAQIAQTYGLVDAEGNLVVGLNNSNIALNDSQRALVAYYLQKQLAAGLTIMTDGDIKNIMALVSALGSSITYLQAYQQAKEMAIGSQMKASSIKGSTAGAQIQRAAYKVQSQAYAAKAIALEKQAYQEIQNAANSAKYTNTISYNAPSSSSSGSGSGSGSGGGSAKEAEETAQTFDWIEVMINRIERGIDNLQRVVDRTYKSWSERNQNLAYEMDAVSNEIKAQQDAYNGYMYMAAIQGLPEEWAQKVRDGAIRIDDVTDETLKEQISNYQEYYEKALDAADAVEELKDKLVELAKTNFDNIQKQFEDQIDLIEHSISMVEGYVDQTETRGYLASTDYYKNLIELENQNIASLQNEYNTLSSTLANMVNSGQIEKYSEEWYSLYSEITDVDEALQDATTSLYEYQNAMRELEWSYFETQQDYISQLTAESDWLIGLLENQGKLINDNGQFTNSGTASMGLHAVNYNTYMAQSDDYAKEIQKINQELATDPYNTILIDKRNELLEAQRDSIDAAYDEIDAVKDLISDAYDQQLEVLQEIIDKRKEALQAEKDLYDYQQSIAEKTNNIASIQKQLDSYAGDDSEEAMSRRQQLQASLEEAQQDLQETEYEKWLSDQEQLLDNLYNEYEELLNQRLDDINFIMNEMLTAANDNAESIKETLTTATNTVGTTLSDEMKSIWESGSGTNAIVTKYGEGFLSSMTTVNSTLEGIRSLVNSMVTAAQQRAAAQAAAEAAKAQQAAINNQVVTTTSPANTNNSNGNGGGAGGGTPGSFFIYKKDNYPKNRLRVDKLYCPL